MKLWSSLVALILNSVVITTAMNRPGTPFPENVLPPAANAAPLAHEQMYEYYKAAQFVKETIFELVKSLPEEKGEKITLFPANLFDPCSKQTNHGMVLECFSDGIPRALLFPLGTLQLVSTKAIVSNRGGKLEELFFSNIMKAFKTEPFNGKFPRYLPQLYEGLNISPHKFYSILEAGRYKFPPAQARADKTSYIPLREAQAMLKIMKDTYESEKKNA